MPKLRGDHYEAARALFQEKTKSGRQRCQAITKGKIRPLRELAPRNLGLPCATCTVLANVVVILAVDR